jgi:hypothetical protein
MLNAKLDSYQKSVYYMELKYWVSTLLSDMKSLNHGVEVFNLALKDSVLPRSYSVEEFFWDFRFSQRRVWSLESSGMYCLVVK